MRTCAVIPCYNNVTTAADIVRRTLVYLPTIAVVDGATDGTLESLMTIQDERLTIVSYTRNRGKGYALKQGFKKARELGYTHVLTLDSDGQHYPEDIPELMKISAVRPEAIIVGSRGTKHANMPQRSTFANRFSNFWFAVQTGWPLPDTQTGFRIYPLDELHGVGLMTRRYEAELLLLVLSAWANTPILPVPIRVYYPPQEERVSYFRPVRDFARISLLNTILCILAIIYGWPRRYWRFVVFGFFFLLFSLFGQLACLIYEAHKTKQAKYRLRRRLCWGCKVFLSSFPGAKYTLRRTGDERAVNGRCAPTPAIYIANHSSLLDIIQLLSLHDRIVIIGQSWITDNPFYGRAAKSLGFMNVKNGIESIVPQLKQWMDEGCSVVVFPEGTRSYNGYPLRFHSGAFYLSEQLNVPIRPVVLQGFTRAMPKYPFSVGAPKQLIATVLPDIMPTDTSLGTTPREKAKNMRQTYIRLLSQVEQG